LLRTDHATEYLTVEHFCTKPGYHALIKCRCFLNKEKTIASEFLFAYITKEINNSLNYEPFTVLSR